MHVVVIGAGIVGVCTAYALRQQGFQVTVVELNPGAAQGASFANAGVLAPAYASPLAQPGMPTRVLQYLFSRHAPLVLRPTLRPATLGWLARWLGECRAKRYVQNKERMYRLAVYSRIVLHEVRDRHAIDFEQGSGYLQLFRSQREFERAAPARAWLSEAGVPFRELTPAQARELEPALVQGAPLAAAVHLPDDETGNCAYFARRLRDVLARDGVEFRFDTTALRLVPGAQGIERLDTDDGPLAADAYVVAAGVESAALLRTAGIRVPLIPVLGYSLTAQIARHEYAPFMSFMDETYKVAVTRMGNRLRVAGTAEIGPRRPRLRESALRTLRKVASDWFPSAASFVNARAWVGARPMLPDGPPLLGATPIPNLYLNVGHGGSGWLLACGSARAVADVVAGRKPEIELAGLTLDRYARGAKA
ncbi:MAG: D-amino acid dehydrogenase [Betaproteobacteria bacterium]